MGWLRLLPAFVAASLLLVTPGALVLRVLGARDMALWGCMVPASLAVTTASAVTAQMIGLRWNLLALVAGTTIFMIIALVLRKLLDRSSPAEHDGVGVRPALCAAACAAACTFLVVVLCASLDSPGSFSQAHDNLFHLSAVRFILESGHGSALTLGSLGTREGTTFYPAAWHDVVALTAQLTGTGVPEAVNATTVAVASVVWPLGAILLCVATIGDRPIAYATGAVGSASFGSFPFLPFTFGPVWPWMLGVAALSGLVALLIDMSRRGGTRRAFPSLIAAGAGIVAAHPGVAVTASILVLPILVHGITRSVSGRGAAAGSVIAYLCLAVLAWAVFRPIRVSNWDGVGDPGLAFLQGLFLAPAGGPPPLLAVLLLWLGLVTAVRKHHAWAAWLFILALGMHVATRLSGWPTVKWWLTGVWYSDPFRPGMLLPLAALPLAALGVAAVTDRLKASPALSTRSRRLGVVLAAGLVTAAVTLANPALAVATDDIAVSTRTSAASALLTPNEREILQEAAALAPRHSMVAGNPMTGAGLVYALFGAPVVEPFAGLARGQNGALISSALDSWQSDDGVCRAVEALDVRYVVDLGGQVLDEYHPPGLDDLAETPGFELVDRRGRSRLYRITACG